jgi:putative FmdB family regulatory protein
MPTYDYACEACGHTFEHFQSMSSPRLVTCPACKRRKLIRLVGSGAGVIFKGSGFYETDYKRPAAAAKGGETEGKGSGGDGTSGDASSGKAAPAKDAPPASGGGAASSGGAAAKGGPSGGGKSGGTSGTGAGA